MSTGSSLHATLVTPLSGSLAGYGRAGATALGLWADRYARRAVELSVHDAHPDPVAALRAAEQERPRLLFGPYGSGPAIAVARSASRPVWNHGGASSALARAPGVVSVLAPAATYFAGALEALDQQAPGRRRAAVVASDTGFGRDVATGAVQAGGRLGWEVSREVLPGDPPAADLLLVVGSFGDEVAAARRLLGGPWRAAAFVGAGVAEVLASLGDRREGLLGPAQWLPTAAPDPDLGPPTADFVASYRARAGEEPPYPAAQALAAGLIAERCAELAETSDDADLLAAARSLQCTTLFGHFRLDPRHGHQVGHRVLTVQWQEGRRRVVWPPELAEAQVRARQDPPDRG